MTQALDLSSSSALTGIGREKPKNSGLICAIACSGNGENTFMGIDGVFLRPNLDFQPGTPPYYSSSSPPCRWVLHQPGCQKVDGVSTRCGLEVHAVARGERIFVGLGFIKNLLKVIQITFLGPGAPIMLAIIKGILFFLSIRTSLWNYRRKKRDKDRELRLNEYSSPFLRWAQRYLITILPQYRGKWFSCRPHNSENHLASKRYSF